ncbi:XrtA/PEP-CTERM system TPR-repeat protein PrsT [Aliiglaciecola sp. LCG003]|uniref:XrtA/PEP-CTERM system TPR-repeat protein PrsT n=1 Tax=Aliiglaciecola sp. LCG003 TaxID=3053655 RepID=UPI002572D2D0|nr:XrtA/PEP-CTERM system TPR-repeat protein PrsT [Aliiglaciecola sp. LCG003]WJG08941.1 PEP-CTERM system TPR-repeat protein PrsT [Aliiglaciecola sp. LCG003]
MRSLFLAVSLSLILGCSQKSSEEHLQSAQDFVAQKKFNSAVVELKNAVQMEPKNPAARFALGKVYLMQKQYESAEKELNRALEFGQPASDVIPLLSIAYQNTGAYAELSQIDHKEAGMTAEQEIEVGFFKVQSLVQLDKLEEAKTLIEELNGIDVDTVYKGLLDIYGSILNQNTEGAADKAQQLVSRFPDNADLLKLQGQLYLRLNQPGKATEVYTKYIETYPDDTQTVFVLAKLLVDSGKILEAEPYIDQLLTINQDNALLNQLKSVVSAAKEQHADAQKYAEKAIQNGRGDPVLRMIAGYAAYILKDFEAANTHLSYIASSLPANHPALKMLAASQLQLGMSGEATDVLNNLGEVSEKDAKLFSKAGYELIRAGNIKDAKQVVERSASISRTAEDLTRLGVLRLSLNDVSGILDLEKALEQSPELEVTRATLANAYLSTNDLDKAEELANDWKTASPQDIKAYILAGEVRLKREEYDAALAEFNKAKELEPDNGLIALAIANIDLTQGNFAEGDKKLLAILERKSDFIPALAAYYLSKRQQKQGEAGMQPSLAALKAKPNETGLAMLVARLYLSEQKWQKAIDVANRVPEDESTPMSYWNSKGKALLALRGVADANQHYDRWLERYPNSRDANLGKLLLLDAKADFKEGAKRAADFLLIRDDISIKMLHIHFLVMSGKISEAKVAYASLPDEYKQLPVAQGFMARIMLSEGKFKEALPLSQVTYKNIPNDRNVVLLAANLERVGDKSEALSVLENHSKQYPNDLGAKMMLAERQISGDQSEAIATYEKSLQLNPNNFVVLNNLAYLYTQTGRLREAEQYARKAVSQRPNNADAVDTLAQALVKQEKYEEALKFYDRVINQDMKKNEIYLNYVEVLFSNGNNALARRKLTDRKFEGEDAKRVEKIKAQNGL